MGWVIERDEKEGRSKWKKWNQIAQNLIDAGLVLRVAGFMIGNSTNNCNRSKRYLPR